MDLRLERNNVEEKLGTCPIEIIDDDEEFNCPESIFDEDPFSAENLKKMKRVRERLAEAKVKKKAAAEKALVSKRKEVIDAAAEKASAYMLTMYDKEDVAEKLTLVERQKDLEPLRSILHRMRSSQPWRALTPQPSNYNDILDTLRRRYPHFSPIVEMLRARMRLNSLKKSPVVDFGANILLLGAPGCGKSAFLYELGEALGTRFAAISCAAATTSADLTGLSNSWSNGHPGSVHDLLIQQECANPIMLLDEIDKAQSDGQHPFMAALYGLLEKNNARKFKDQYVDIDINASRINWFASANDLSSLSAPIRDRFEVVYVKQPSKNELRLILQQIYERQVCDHGLDGIFSTVLAEDVIEVVLERNLSIRRCKGLLEASLANASVRAGKNQQMLILKSEDVPASELELGSDRKIGFIH